jgi:glycosyltransferase involved in cell wall biosynthesis
MSDCQVVSVIVPAYEHEAFVQTALRSLIAQTYAPLELIVIDDGSRDGTFGRVEELLPELQARFVRVHLQRGLHLGGAANISRCLASATCDLVYLLDSDDTSDPDAIERLLPLLEQDRVALAVGDNRYIDEQGRPYSPLRGGVPHETLINFHTADRPGFRLERDFGTYESLIRGNYVPNGWLLRKSAVAAVGGYPTDFVLDDWPLLLKLAREFRIAYAGAALGCYRVHRRNSSKRLYDRLVFDTIRILLNERQACRERGLEDAWWEHLCLVVGAVTPSLLAESELANSIPAPRPIDALQDLQTLVAAARSGAGPHVPSPKASVATFPPLPPPTSAKGQRIHLYALSWNDALQLPFFFRHYDQWVQRYVIYDDGSDDETLSILSAHPRVEIRRFVRTRSDSFVLSELSFYENCWKESRGAADWVFLVDVDEHLDHHDLVGYLSWCQSEGVTAVPALGFEMVTEAFPSAAERLADTQRRGAPSLDMCKLSIFAPDAIAALQQTPGGHRSRPLGAILPPRDDVRLLHYKYLGLEYVTSRHQTLKDRLCATDRKAGWGHQWTLAPDEQQKEFDRNLAVSVDVGATTVEAFPEPPWWVGILPRIEDKPRLQTAEQALEAAKSANFELLQQLNAVSARVADMEGSRTWRWTSGVRWLVGLLMGSKAQPAGRPGEPELRWPSPAVRVRDLVSYGRIGRYVWHSRQIIGWTRGAEAPAVADASHRLPGAPVIVEIGCFLGCATVLLAGARRLRGAGRIHCIDPFDGSGDAFSIPVYRSIAASLRGSLRETFESNVRRAGLSNFVTVHQTTAAAAAASWTTPVDLLYLDGDISRTGARDTYLAWERWLRPGGMLILSSTQTTEEDHDGPMHVVQEFIRPPAYGDIRQVDGITLARKN